MKHLIQPALLLATLAFGAAPALTPPFTGYDPAIFPTYVARPAIQPAGYAFAIWGVIYLWLISHAAFGLWQRRGNPDFTAPAPALTLSIVLGTLWLAIAAKAPILATVVILVMAALALRAYLQAHPQRDRWLLCAPLAIYAGWLTAAAAVSTGVILSGYGLLTNTAAALVMLTLVLGTALWVQSKRPHMPVYGATVTWALAGIVAVNWDDNPTVAYAAIAGGLIMASATLALRRR